MSKSDEKTKRVNDDAGIALFMVIMILVVIPFVIILLALIAWILGF